MKRTITQSQQLKRIIKESIAVILVGVILMAVTISVNARVVVMAGEERQTTNCLNQYRLASKSLTYNVQAFAVTAKQDYYDEYMKEVNETKNRDKAISAKQRVWRRL